MLYYVPVLWYRLMLRLKNIKHGIINNAPSSGDIAHSHGIVAGFPTMNDTGR